MLYTADVSEPFRLKRSIAIVTREDHDGRTESRRYWATRPAAERLAAVEFLRQQIHGTGARLQRILRVTERTSR